MGIEYFDRITPNKIENIIREQCTNDIKEKLKIYNFGFIILENPPEIYNYVLSNPMYRYVLCKLVPDPLLPTISINIVGSLENSKNGELLFDAIEKKGKELNYKCITFIVIGNISDIKWYLSLGYRVYSERPIQIHKLNAYLMQKYI